MCRFAFEATKKVQVIFNLSGHTDVGICLKRGTSFCNLTHTSWARAQMDICSWSRGNNQVHNTMALLPPPLFLPLCLTFTHSNLAVSLTSMQCDHSHICQLPLDTAISASPTTIQGRDFFRNTYLCTPLQHPSDMLKDRFTFF